MNPTGGSGRSYTQQEYDAAFQQAREDFRIAKGKNFSEQLFGDQMQRAEIKEWIEEMAKTFNESNQMQAETAERTEAYMRRIKEGRKGIKDELYLRQQVQAAVKKTSDLTADILKTQLAISRGEMKSLDIEKKLTKMAELRSSEYASQKRVNDLLKDYRKNRVELFQLEKNYQANYIARENLTAKKQLKLAEFETKSAKLKTDIEAAKLTGDTAGAKRLEDRLNSATQSAVRQSLIQREKLSNQEIQDYTDYRTKREALVENRKSLPKGSNEYKQSERDIEALDHGFRIITDKIDRTFKQHAKDSLGDTNDRIAGLRATSMGIDEGIDALEKATKELKKQQVLVEKTERKLGLIFNVVDHLGHTRLGRLFDFDDAKRSMQHAHQFGGESGNPTMRMLGAGGRTLLQGVAGKVLTVKAAWDILEFAISSMAKADKRTTELAKTFGVMKDQAREMYDIYEHRLNLQVSEGLLMDDIVGAQLKFNESMGVAFMLNQQMNVSLAQSQALMKLSDEAIAGQVENSFVLGYTQEDIRETILGTSKIQQMQSKNYLNDKQILEAVLKTTGGMRANFKGNLEALTKAVTQAKLFGYELDQVGKTGESLLDWQSSIDSELEAELLTQRSLNLERARAYALTGDMDGLMREMKKEIGGLDQFLSGNIIQQQALAKAFGMSRDEMSDMLFKGEMMTKLQQVTADNLHKRTQESNQQYLERIQKDTAFRTKYEEIMKMNNISEEKRAKLIGAEVEQSIQQLSAQDKFEKSIGMMKDKIGELFGNGALLDNLADALIKFLRLFGDTPGVYTTEEKKKQPFLDKASRAMNSGKLSSSEIDELNGLSLAKSRTRLSWSPGDALIHGDGRYRDHRFDQLIKTAGVNDGVIDPDGRLIYSAQYGAIKPHPKDYLIATPNPGALMGGDVSMLKPLLEQLIAAVQRGDMAVIEALKTGMDVKLNGTRVTEGIQKSANKL